MAGGGGGRGKGEGGGRDVLAVRADVLWALWAFQKQERSHFERCVVAFRPGRRVCAGAIWACSDAIWRFLLRYFVLFCFFFGFCLIFIVLMSQSYRQKDVGVAEGQQRQEHIFIQVTLIDVGVVHSPRSKGVQSTTYNLHVTL